MNDFQHKEVVMSIKVLNTLLFLLIVSGIAAADPKSWIVRSDTGSMIGSAHTTQQAAIDAAIAAANAQPNKKFFVFGIEKIVILPTSTISITDPDPVP